MSCSASDLTLMKQRIVIDMKKFSCSSQTGVSVAPERPELKRKGPSGYIPAELSK